MWKKSDFQRGYRGYRCMMYDEVSVQKWCILFNGGRTNIPVEESKGRSSVVIDEMKAKIEVKVQENRHGCTNFYRNSWNTNNCWSINL